MFTSFGAELRSRRLAAGLSLADLARTLSYSKSHLSKIETGAKASSQDLARRCDAALQASGALAALVAPRPPTNGIEPTVPGDAERRRDAESQWIMRLDPDGRGEFGATPRRGVLVAGALSVSGWAVSAGGSASEFHSSEFSTFRAMFDQARRLSQAMPPAVLIPVLIAQTHAMRLAAARALPASRPQLLMLAGRYAELTGWMAQEAGDDHAALWWTDRAVEFATAGNDPRLASYALVRRADIALYRRDAAETVALARHVQTMDCGDRISGLAAQREAQGHALAGDYDSCQRALERATVRLDRLDEEGPQPMLGSSTVENLVDMATGWCLHDLGRPREAGVALARQLAQTAAGAHRTRARLGARHVLAMLAGGEVEEGCARLRLVLDTSSWIDSATIRTDLRRVAGELNRWPGNSAVREILPHLTAALSER